MTVHNSSDAKVIGNLAAEMMTIGAAARDAARAMREASDDTKTRRCASPPPPFAAAPPKFWPPTRPTSKLPRLPIFRPT